MADLGWQELMIILVVVLIVFGAGKLPEVAKSLGQGVKEFRAEASALPSARTTSESTASVSPAERAQPPHDESIRASAI